jgi:hypothetical protein
MTAYERMMAGEDLNRAGTFAQAGPQAATTREKVADSAIALGTGLIGGVKMLTDVGGADNSFSQALGDAQKSLDAKTSDERQYERRQRQKQIKDAELYGSAWDEVVANAGAFADAPLDSTLSALGSAAPALLASFLPGGQAGVAVRLIGAGAVGAAQGVGVVKGSIYDRVEQGLQQAGYDQDTARKVAAGAQAYDGENGGLIAANGAMGALAAMTGTGPAVAKYLSRAGAVPSVARSWRGAVGDVALGTVKEAVPEGGQAVLERGTSNLAIQGVGLQYGVPDMAATRATDGLAGAFTADALGSLGLGAAGGGLRTRPPSTVTTITSGTPATPTRSSAPTQATATPTQATTTRSSAPTQAAPTPDGEPEAAPQPAWDADMRKLVADMAQELRDDGRQVEVTEPDVNAPETIATNAFMDALAGLTGHRGIAVKAVGKGAFDGVKVGGNYFVNVDKPEMAIPFTIAHEFKHLTEGRPGLEKLYGRMWDLIPGEARNTYATTILRREFAGRTTDKLNAGETDMLKSEMLADFMGQRFTDKAWLKDLSKQRPALFAEFVRDWVKLLNSMIYRVTEKLRKLRANSDIEQIKQIDPLMRGHLKQLREMKTIATDVATEWAQANPALVKRYGANDFAKT